MIIPAIAAIWAGISVVSFVVYTRQSRQAAEVGCDQLRPVPILFPYGLFLTQFWFDPTAPDCPRDGIQPGGGLPGGGGGRDPGGDPPGQPIQPIGPVDPPPIIPFGGGGGGGGGIGGEPYYPTSGYTSDAVRFPPSKSDQYSGSPFNINQLYPSSSSTTVSSNTYEVQDSPFGMGTTVPVDQVFGMNSGLAGAIGVMDPRSYVAQRVTGDQTAQILDSTAPSLYKYNTRYFKAGDNDPNYNPWEAFNNPNYHYSTPSSSDSFSYDSTFMQSTGAIQTTEGGLTAFLPPLLQDYYEGGKWYGNTGGPAQPGDPSYAIGKASTFYLDTDPQYAYNAPVTTYDIPQTNYNLNNPPDPTVRIQTLGRQLAYGNPLKPYTGDDGGLNDAYDSSASFSTPGWGTTTTSYANGSDNPQIPPSAMYIQDQLSGPTVTRYIAAEEQITHGGDPAYVWVSDTVYDGSH